MAITNMLFRLYKDGRRPLDQPLLFSTPPRSLPLLYVYRFFDRMSFSALAKAVDNGVIY